MSYKVGCNLLWDKISKEDDLASFKKLHGLYYAKLCDFSFLYLKDKLSCEEVVSDVFVMLWKKRHELQHVDNLQSYLYSCTKNLSIDLLRKNSRGINMETELFEIEETDFAEEFFPECDMVEFRKELQSAINKLPSQCRLIFRMLLNDQLTSAEIADILGLSKKTIESQVKIAYKKLVVMLRKSYEKDIRMMR